ncbi:MAG: family 20 glycosylhydrolase [Bacteroidota bacterium]|nr:family 20 glycosylhydrolase [Bacteroidota bacterium]
MRLTTSLLISLFFATTTLAQQKQLTIIPWPLELKQHPGHYMLKDKITVSNSLPEHEWKGLFSYFKVEMKKQFNITVTEAPKEEKGDIDFFMKRMPTSGKPAYQLEVSKEGIRINSNFSEPTFHAIQTFFQLIPLNVISSKREIPFVEIFDYARFNYRGMHLDVGRHFFPVSFIKKYIDYLAYHKFNTFHFHLTEDQGWRIEIKKYPKLTSVGAWRNGTIIGRYPGTGNDGKKYGGFYTQKQIKEIVKYATERFITVIPEIEMPGHSSAAIAAYPELSCFPAKSTAYPKECAWSGPAKGKQVQQTWGVFDDVFCAGKENTFTFLENLLEEVLALFPSKYIHVGGDESPKAHWQQCSACQQRIKDNKLKDEHELQSYFIQRMEKYLNSKGRILIGWDEILEGGLAPNAVVMSWRGEQGGIEAARQNHDVIMTPGNPVYFDHSQSENEDSVTIGGYNPIEKVYAYEPVPKELNEEQGKYILGAQANMWTEYMKNTNKVEYMLFPRIAALSEVLWSKKENKNWEDFEKRLMTQFKRYELEKVNYSKAYFDLKATVMPAENYTGILYALDSKLKNDSILYTSSSGSGQSKPQFYKNPIVITQTGKTYAFQRIAVYISNIIIQQFYFNKATGKKITLAIPASNKYPGDGAFTLVNGVQNEKGMSKTNEFLGFSGDDCITTIDLAKTESMSFVKVHYLHHPGSWIYQPSSILISVSQDGKDFTTVSLSKAAISNNEAIGEFMQPVTARFIKIHVANAGVIPTGYPGAGNKAWLFVDEIEVN